jgi:Tfp pilus assembly protein PilF
VLATAPDNGVAHALLAVCLTETGRDEEALAESEEALRRRPASPSVWRIRSFVLRRARRHREALAAANEAVRLDPGQAMSLIRRAEARSSGGDLKGALRDVDAALAIDPTLAGGHQFRAAVLTLLGQGDEAEAAGRESLRIDPEAPGAHAALGWQMLHAGDPAKAQAEFREALRLDPSMEWARLGLVETLKARNPVYRPVLRYLLWMARSRTAKIALLAGMLVAVEVGRLAAPTNPALRPYAAVGLLLCLLLLPAVFIAGPLFNATLWLRRERRHLLSFDERHATAMVVACLAAGATLATVWVVTDDGIFALAGISIALLSMAAGVAFSRRPGITRRVTSVLAAASVPLMMTGLALALTGYGAPTSADTAQNGLLALLVLAPGFVGFMSRSIIFRALTGAHSR